MECAAGLLGVGAGLSGGVEAADDVSKICTGPCMDSVVAITVFGVFFVDELSDE